MTRETLTREQIINTAISLLDNGDVKSLNMRQLGQALGGATTAVYWHVPSKKDLLGLAVDHTWKEVALPDYKSMGWREAAQVLAQGTYSLIASHPWLMVAMIDYGAYGVNRAKHQKHCYETLQEAGFRGTSLDAAVNTLLTFTFGAAFAGTMDDTEALNAAADLPHSRHQADQIKIDSNKVKREHFEFGLEIILSGLEAKLKSAER